MQILVWMCWAVGIASVVTTAATYVTAVRLRKKRKQPSHYPAVSILKPLKGVDAGLYENLASIAQQSYPHFEIILGAEDPNDPALEIAEKLRRNFPHVPITVVRGAPAFGVNGKVRNLAELIKFARFEHILISDANVRAPGDYLCTMASELSIPGTGMVSSLLVGASDRALGSRFESLHLQGFVAGTVAASHAWAHHPCVVGKSMLFKKSDLSRVGGFSAVRNILAEDYVLGQMFHRAGLRVALCASPLTVVNHERSLGDFFSRHLRWHQMRRHLAPGAYTAEILLNPVVWFLGAAALVGNVQSMLVAAGGMVVKCLIDAWVSKSLGGQGLRGRDFLWVPIKDLVILGAWLGGFISQTVQWRGRLMRICAGSRIEPYRTHSVGQINLAHWIQEVA